MISELLVFLDVIANSLMKYIKKNKTAFSTLETEF